MTILRKTCGSLMALCAATMVTSGWAQTTDLKSAIAAAIDSHPEINQAVQNKEAIEFEREQAKGLYLPRVSVEGSAGIRRLENNTRRTLGIGDQTLYPLEASVLAEQTLFDSGYRSAEKRRQAARIDGAALRVGERSQFVALNVTRQYLDYMLQQRVVAAAEDNIAFHRKLLGDLGEGVSKGSISIADQQQAEERLQSALVRKSEAEQDLTNAAISFRTLTGLSIDQVSMPDAVTSAVPPTLDEAIAGARTNNPLIRKRRLTSRRRMQSWMRQSRISGRRLCWKGAAASVRMWMASVAAPTMCRGASSCAGSCSMAASTGRRSRK